VPRGEALRRQWQLLQLLQSHRYGLTVDELAEKLGCSKRTIQRDLNVLREVNLPIMYQQVEDSPGKRRYFLPSQYINKNDLWLTITEALSLYLARAFMAPLAGTTIGDAFESLVNRIEQTLSNAARKHFRNLQNLLLVLPAGQPDYSAKRDIVSAVDQAVREQKVLKITYHSPWRPEKYQTEIHPYGIVFWQGDLYVVAYSKRAAEIRIFKVTRILTAELTQKTFHKPPDFDLEDYFAPSLSVTRSGRKFEAVVEFTGPAAALALERRWHPSQRIIHRSDDRVVMKFVISDSIGLKQWIKTFGRHARLLEPDWLREELRCELLAMAALYEQPPTSDEAA